MAPHISFRDVTFSDFRYDVHISVITDIPCHLWCRRTTVEPQIHQKPMKRRGVVFSSELRFCFVSYDDFEQIEAGDTTTHSFIIPDWSYCKTRWVYFWGYVGGVISPSTSPFFKHHNARIYQPDISLGWNYPALNNATMQNRAIITSARPATGAGVLTYLRLYASPYPMDHYYYVAVVRRAGPTLFSVRQVVKLHADSQGYHYYTVNMPVAQDDCLAVWGVWGSIRDAFSMTEGMISDYYYSNPFIVGQTLNFNFLGYYSALGVYADNFTTP